ncbi:hypothetical protein [Streptomyces sp. 142MFCol3.1]|uniref:hypothetical protein n=1 Tax=Streptomyces sp. 142MFCol3.1 TaxID=1172179 RepID=UPI00131A2740|nr:hypothetical protein [Streptomyces sp. 142MFCol3.1]
MNSFSPALGAAEGTSPTELCASYGLRGLMLAAFVMAVVRLGGHIVGALSARALAPSQRQLRWLLKHGHVAGQLTAQQAVELTQATHAQEMQVRQAAPSNVQPPGPPDSGAASPETAVPEAAPLDSGAATPGAAPPEATPGADDSPRVPRAEATALLSRRRDATGP